MMNALMEPVAVWIEAVALVAIFGLDFSEFRRQGKDRKEQHDETIKQMQIMEKQASATFGSFQLLQERWNEERRRELIRAIAVLDDIRYQTLLWRDITDNKWGTVNRATPILPPDADIVVIEAGRHSKALRDEVRKTFRTLSNAEYQIGRYYSVDLANYRDDSLMQGAHAHIKNAEGSVSRIIGTFEQIEAAEAER